MGKIIETKIDDFRGGISDDAREKIPNKFSMTQHFDIFSRPKRLIPYRDSDALETKSFEISSFEFVNSVMYGLGEKSGGSIAKVYDMSSPSGASPSWAAVTTGEGTSGSVIQTMFKHYKDYLYLYQGSNRISRWNIGGTFTNDWKNTSATITSSCQAVVHPSDDILYGAFNNIIWKNDDGTWSEVLTLPTNIKIMSLTTLGDYLAIGTAPIRVAEGKSNVYLWDRDSSLTDVSAKIDWGEGELTVLENLQGVLVGVSDVLLNSGFGLDTRSVTIKTYEGGAVRVIQELKQNSATAGNIIQDSYVKNNKMYFSMRMITELVGALEGIWVIGRKTNKDPLAITLDYVEEDAGNWQGFFPMGNFWWIAHSTDGSVNRTNDSASYTFTSIYESQIFNTEDPSLKKDLLGATVTTNFLPTAGQVVLQYRKDEDIGSSTGWTTIFTEATDSSISFSAVTSLTKGRRSVGNIYGACNISCWDTKFKGSVFKCVVELFLVYKSCFK